MKIVSASTFAVRLKIARKKAKVTQSELAAIANVQQGTVCGWELGTFKPHPDKWHLISDALNVSIADLFLEDDSEIKNVNAEGTAE